MSLIKLGICGASGKMGQTLVKSVASNKELKLTSALEFSGSFNLGKDSGLVAGLEPNKVIITDNAKQFFSALDVVIDFSSSESTIENIVKACEANCSYVLGTTGLSNKTIEIINDCSKKIGIVMSSNMSLGINIALYLTEQVAGLLDQEYDVEIHEIHHKEKIDAPSGTALALGKAVAAGRKIDLKENSIYSRQGNTGRRKKGSIGFSVERGGDVVGDHTTSFIGPGERIEILHKASDRAIFANGALKAAKWLCSQSPGLYSMKDVLGIE